MISFHQQAVISTKELTFSSQLLKYCKTNACGNYNKSWTCPPDCGSIEEQKNKILKYEEALILTTKHNIEDSFDYDGMNRARSQHTLLTLETRNKLAKKKCAPVLAYGAGACPVCQNEGGCSFPKPCRYPDKQIGSIEAAGIDVAELSKTCGISYYNGPNTVTFFSLIVYN